jgi:hypothetical protein
MSSAKHAPAWGAPDCPVPRPTPTPNSSLSGIYRGAATKIHQTIRCAPDCPVSQRCLRPTVDSAINGRHVAEPTVTWSHRTIRCTKGTEGPTVGFASKGRRSGTGQTLFMSGGAPDCPVRHPTKGKNCLPNGTLTAPSCLGAIKGTPRRMEHNTKHSPNILRCLDSATTQSDHRV